MATRRRAELPGAEPQVAWLRGSIELRRKRPAAAVTLLERALAHPALKAGNDRGSVEFDLAQALWDIGRDRRQALTLARQARTAVRGDKTADPAMAQHLEAWLAAHDRP